MYRELLYDTVAIVEKLMSALWLHLAESSGCKYTPKRLSIIARGAAAPPHAIALARITQNVLPPLREWQECTVRLHQQPPCGAHVGDAAANACPAIFPSSMRPQSVTYATSSAYVIVPDTNVSFGPSDLPTRSLHAMLATLRLPFPGALHCDWWRSVPPALRSGGDRTPRDMARDMPYASGQIGEQPCGVSATSGNPPGVVLLRIYENNRCTLRSWKKPYGYLS